MSAHSYSPLQANREVLGELLHSVSQPLTTLRCSLELSLDETAEHQQQAVAAALEQTESVIGMIQLMREYLDAEQSAVGGLAIAFMPVLRNVVDELSPLGAIRNVRVRITGTCTAALSITAPWMRRALEYLISAMIERQPPGSEVAVLLDECPGEVRVSFRSKRGFGLRSFSDASLPKTSTWETIQRVRLVIAARVLEIAGATLDFDDRLPGLVLRIRQPGGPDA